MESNLHIFLRTTSYLTDLTQILELSCCKITQKCPNHETGLGNRRRLKVVNDTKLGLNEHE